MFGLSGNPTLPDGQWFLQMAILLGLLALFVFGPRRRGARQRAEAGAGAPRRNLMVRLALGAVVLFVLWFGMVFAMGAGPLLKALAAD